MDTAPDAVSPTGDDDRRLVAEARRGDPGAFRTLVERHQRRVFAMALSMLHDRDVAKDVAQDAFIKAYKALGEFEGSASFSTWIYRIALNQCIDRLRHLQRFTHEAFEDALSTEMVSAFEVAPLRLGFDPAQALRDREIRERVMGALEQLSDLHRATVVLREVEGLSYKEIAAAMNCSVGTVMSRLFNARKRLQELLAPLNENNEGSER